MKALYFECNMGAAGDMLMASLLELHEDPGGFLSRLNGAGIPNVSVTAEKAIKRGVTGTHMRVSVSGLEEGLKPHCHCGGEHTHGHSRICHSHEHDHHHGPSVDSIEKLITGLAVPAEVIEHALSVYRLLAEAESRVHGEPIGHIHLSEVGAMDAVADIVGVCLLICELDPDIILSSPINTGSGYVKCSHGILPVPAPATAHILTGVPVYCGDSKGELCTPTGAALLKHFVKEFCRLPSITISKIGYGMGTKDFEAANCVRAFYGSIDNNTDSVVELVCNLDDMTPEAVSYAQQLLLDEGALDVYTSPIIMKKGRLGIRLSCIAGMDAKDKMLALIFKHTSTLGVREFPIRRFILCRNETEINTDLGVVRIKNSEGFGVKKSKPEYEDIAEIAKRNGMSIQDVIGQI